MERKTNNRVLDMIGSGLLVGRSMAKRMMRFFGHIMRKDIIEKWLIKGKVNRLVEYNKYLFPA